MYPKRVMILASDPQLISALQDALTVASFEVEVALNETVGLSILGERRMDAVILDTPISSAGENGLADRIANMATSAVVLLGSKKPRKALPKGVGGAASQVFIQKPVDAHAIIRELKGLLAPKPEPKPARHRQRIKLTRNRKASVLRKRILAAKRIRKQKRTAKARR